MLISSQFVGTGPSVALLGGKTLCYWRALQQLEQEQTGLGKKKKNLPPADLDKQKYCREYLKTLSLMLFRPIAHFINLRHFGHFGNLNSSNTCCSCCFVKELKEGIFLWQGLSPSSFHRSHNRTLTPLHHRSPLTSTSNPPTPLVSYVVCPPSSFSTPTCVLFFDSHIIVWCWQTASLQPQLSK